MREVQYIPSSSVVVRSAQPLHFPNAVCFCSKLSSCCASWFRRYAQLERDATPPKQTVFRTARDLRQAGSCLSCRSAFCCPRILEGVWTKKFCKSQELHKFATELWLQICCCVLRASLEQIETNGPAGAKQPSQGFRNGPQRAKHLKGSFVRAPRPRPAARPPASKFPFILKVHGGWDRLNKQA